MSKPWQYISNNRLTCPPSANVGSLHISCGYLGNGDFGPTGPTGPTPDGDCYGDYLYWDNTTNSWAVGSEKINLGCGAGQFNQGDKSVAIGYEAGFTGQTLNSVAIGNNAGHYRQGDTGTGNPGNTGNTGNAVAIGNSAGQFDQAANTVAIGNLAGQYEQQQYSVAIGRQSGRYGQNYEAVAIGNLAGNTGQNIYGIAIGSNAGADNQGEYSVAIGRLTGQHNQGDDSIAIGREAGHTGSGQTGQGNHAVAIGYQAGYTNQHNNTIVLNASGSALNTGTTGAFYVKPIRGLTGPNYLYYNDTTGEITYSPYVQGQLINTKIITESINAGDFSPGVTGNTEILGPTGSITYNIDYTILNPIYTNSIISIDIDLPYNYSGTLNDYITVSINDPNGIVRFNKYQYWRSTDSGGGGTRSGTIFPLSCSFSTSGFTAANSDIKLIIENKGDDVIRLFSGRTGSNAADVTALPYLSIKISEYQAL